MIQKYPEFIYSKSSTCPLDLTGLKWPLSWDLHVTCHCCVFQTSTRKESAYSCPSPKFPDSSEPEVSSKLSASWRVCGTRDEAGTSFAVRTPPSGLNQSGWAVPSRMSSLPKINLLTEGCHELTDSFSLLPHVSHSFPNWGSRTVTVHLLSIKSNPDGKI